MEWNKATIQNVVIAYCNGILSKETLRAVERCDIRHDFNDDGDTLGKMYNYETFKYIVINDKVIEKYFGRGYLFYGIQPEDINHAIQLVIEHEVCHLIMALEFPNAPFGHEKLFATLTGFIFDHATTEIEEEINDK